MEEETSRVTLTDTEIDKDFLLENQDIKLENLPRYEDMIAPNNVSMPELENMQEVNELPFLQEKKKQEVPAPDNSSKKRFKIATATFATVGILLLGLVVVNAFTLGMMKRDIDANNKQITTLTEEVQTLSEKELESAGLTANAGEKVPYKLAFPRNYPDNSADLTWLDKISIFLMKIFG